MAPVLIQLRQAIRQSKPIGLVPEGADLASATGLSLDGVEASLDEKTDFVSGDNVNHVLRTVYQCWLHNESNTTEYIADCESKKIPVISFLERTELISFLNGSSETCAYLKADSSSAAEISSGATTDGNAVGEKRSAEDAENSGKKRKREIDPFLKEVLSNERNLIDHNRALRGAKPVDFASVAKECEYKIIRAAKQKGSSSAKTHGKSSSSLSKSSSTTSSSTISSSSNGSSTKNKEPIIILSPSASSILTMNNVKDFLQDGTFINSTDMPLSTTNMLQLSRDSKKFNRKIRFLVVSNVDKFFTKPEHWDRVVAVFTTGQEWQFKNYKYSQPSVLFQKVKGFYLYFSGDTIPEKVKSWNVQPISIERNQRYKDKQTSEFLWESLERFLATKGFK